MAMFDQWRCSTSFSGLPPPVQTLCQSVQPKKFLVDRKAHGLFLGCGALQERDHYCGAVPESYSLKAGVIAEHDGLKALTSRRCKAFLSDFDRH